MEKSTVIGITAGLASIGIGMYLKGADPHALINPAAYLIIFAGTAAALFNAFTMKELKRFPVLCKIIFCGQKLTDKQGEKFQSNPEIAGSPRNSFRASLVLTLWR